MYFITTENVDELQSLTASEEADSTLAVTNIQDPLGSKRWRSTGVTPYIYGQFAASTSPDFWGVWYCNAQSGDQARLRLATSQANLTASPTKDTGLVDVWPGTGDLSGWSYVHQRATISSPAAGTWFRIDFDFTGNSDGYVEVGALFLAVRFTPELGHRSGWEIRPEVRAMYEAGYQAGGLGRGGGSYKRGTEFSFLRLTEAEALGSLEPMLRERAEVVPVGVVLDEDEATYPMHFMYYGYLDVETIQVPSGRYAAMCEIKEP